MSEPRIPTRAELAELASLGCSDHGCRFRTPVGMGTNGGCRCLGEKSQVKQLRRLGDLSRGAVAALDIAVEALRAMPCSKYGPTHGWNGWTCEDEGKVREHDWCPRCTALRRLGIEP